MLGLALTLDIGDTIGMTAAGLHIANLAGVWQAMLGGFAGVAVQAGVVTVDPRLPDCVGRPRDPLPVPWPPGPAEHHPRRCLHPRRRPAPGLPGRR